MKTPTITLNGKTFTPAPPKVKLWREITKFKEKFSDALPTDEQALDEMEDLIVSAFNCSEITRETIDEQLNLGEFIPLFTQIAEWVAEVVTGKASELPNGDTPTV